MSKTTGKSTNPKWSDLKAIETIHIPVHPALVPHFGYCFTKSALKLRKAFIDALETIGVQLPYMGVMLILDHEGPINQMRLGEITTVDKATMVKLLDSMEESGLLRRKPDPTDRRVKLVELTPKGRALLPKIMKMREEIEERFLAPLTKNEISEFRRLVTKLVKT